MSFAATIIRGYAFSTAAITLAHTHTPRTHTHSHIWTHKDAHTQGKETLRLRHTHTHTLTDTDRQAQTAEWGASRAASRLLLSMRSTRWPPVGPRPSGQLCARLGTKEIGGPTKKQGLAKVKPQRFLCYGIGEWHYPSLVERLTCSVLHIGRVLTATPGWRLFDRSVEEFVYFHELVYLSYGICLFLSNSVHGSPLSLCFYLIPEVSDCLRHLNNNCF